MSLFLDKGQTIDKTKTGYRVTIHPLSTAASLSALTANTDGIKVQDAAGTYLIGTSANFSGPPVGTELWIPKGSKVESADTNNSRFYLIASERQIVSSGAGGTDYDAEDKTFVITGARGTVHVSEGSTDIIGTSGTPANFAAADLPYYLTPGQNITQASSSNAHYITGYVIGNLEEV